MAVPTELYAALAKVASELPAVPKSKQASTAAFKGTYRTYDELLNTAGPLLAREGIILAVNDVELTRENIHKQNKEGQTWTSLMTTLILDVIFCHVSGQTMTVRTTGQSIDQSSFAPGIARTYGVKDVLSRTLLVAFEPEEEEGRAPEPYDTIVEPLHEPFKPLADEVRAAARELNAEEKEALKAWLKSNDFPVVFSELDQAGLEYALQIMKKLKYKLEWPADAFEDPGPTTGYVTTYESAREYWERLSVAEQKEVTRKWGGAPRVALETEAPGENAPSATGLNELHDILLEIANREHEPKPMLGAIRKEAEKTKEEVVEDQDQAKERTINE